VHGKINTDSLFWKHLTHTHPIVPCVDAVNHCDRWCV